MPGNRADIEQHILDAAGALHAHVRHPLAARPVPGLPARSQAGRRHPAARLLKTSLNTLLTILREPGPVRTLDERAGPTAYSCPALFPVTSFTCRVGIIDDTPACEHAGQGRRRGL